MTVLEIVLLVCGIIVFVISFVIPVSKEETSADIQDMIQEEVKKRVTSEVEAIRSHVDDVVDEAVEYAQEKTERSLERISNEKIMAVNEYSDTVLAEINKNHKEVVFMYDMLNDKHDNLMNTVSEANQAAENARISTKEAQEAANTIQQMNHNTNDMEAATAVKPEATKDFGSFREMSSMFSQVSASESIGDVTSKEATPKKVRTLGWAALAEAEAEAMDVKQDEMAIQLDTKVEEDVNPLDYQSGIHQQILLMSKQGMNSVDIARSLNMGVGEVDLIIGLHGGK